jgi:hypothetical protein
MERKAMLKQNEILRTANHKTSMHRLKLYFYRATYSKYSCKKLAAELSN